jgi:hypothetical protein
VGQNVVEEVNFVPFGAGAGWNFGWRCYEGDQEYNTSNCGAGAEYQFPVYQYFHSEDNGCSVTGGYVYRGEEFPSLQGYYFFSDYCNDILYSLRDSSGAWILEKHGQYPGNNFSAFGEDQNGEVYLAGISSGTVYKLTNEGEPTGIGHAEANSWNVYPNPADSQIYLKGPKGETHPERIRLLTASGTVVLDPGVNATAGFLDVSGVPQGIYIIEITEGGRTFYKKLIRD